MNIVQSTLALIRGRLDTHFKASDPRAEDWVILSNVVDHEGHAYEPAKDKIVVLLAGLQQETTVSTHTRAQPLPGGQYAVVTPPLYINLLVLFLANFYDRSYTDGLAMISRTISFFQQNPVFTRDTTPGLDPAIDKITLDMMTLDLHQTNSLMSMIGAKYLPAVLYRARMLVFRSDAIAGVVPAVTGPDVAT